MREESPGFTGRIVLKQRRVTIRDSATEKYGRFGRQGWKGEVRAHRRRATRRHVNLIRKQHRQGYGVARSASERWVVKPYGDVRVEDRCRIQNPAYRLSR